MSIIYKNTITVDEVNSIRAQVGFRQNHLDEVQSGLHGSSYIIAVYKQDQAILVWDSGSVALIEDILVIPQYQMQGYEQR